MKRLLLSLLLVVVCTIVATAQGRAAPVPEWRGALLSGSQRLMLFSLSKTRPPGSFAARMSLARKLGFLHQPGDGLVPGKPVVWLSPILEYDENVNNGVPGASVAIGGLPFDIDEDSRAKAGFVIGAHVGTGLSLAYGEGSTLDISLAGGLRHAPSVDVTRSSLRLSACGNQHLTGWNWLTLCTGYTVSDARDIDTTEEGHFGSVGLRRIFSTPIGSHEGTLTVTRHNIDDYDKISLSGSLTSAITGLGALNVAANLGETVPGENTVVRGLSTSLSRPVFGRDTRLSLGLYKTRGEMFFGTRREDRTYTLSVSRKVHDRLWLGLSARKRNSTMDVYDENELTLDVSFDGWSF